jgi:hypothetical protein
MNGGGKLRLQGLANPREGNAVLSTPIVLITLDLVN